MTPFVVSQVIFHVSFQLLDISEHKLYRMKIWSLLRTQLLVVKDLTEVDWCVRFRHAKMDDCKI